ncbi:hypothetical protein HDU76_010792, partial [Blyttiomyces sp. JEL0837]
MPHDDDFDIPIYGFNPKWLLGPTGDTQEFEVAFRANYAKVVEFMIQAYWDLERIESEGISNAKCVA